MKPAAYGDYKLSGSQWLGEIPSHWSVKKLKFLATVQPSNVDKKTVEGEDPVILCNYTDVYKNEYIDSRLDFMQASATADEIKKFAVDIGDVIVTKDSETPDDIAVPACVAEKIDGLLCGYHLTQIKPIDLDGRYLFRLFQSKGFNAQFTIAANGVTRFGLPQHAIANAPSPIPPMDEQQAIARFLDFKTAQIDALIAKKKILLEKLAEKRTALISHAVTKGLDPSVPMRDSGVEWLGEIPAHWDIWKVTHGFGKIGSGTTPKSDNPLFYDGEIPWVTTSELRESVIFDTAQKVTGEAVAMHSALKVYPAGSLAIAMYGATIGRLGILGVDATFNQACCVFSDPLVFDTQFVYYWLWMRRPILISLSNGGGQPNLSQDDLKKLWIPIPDLNEQRGIVRFLDIKTSVVDEQVKKVEEVIARLSEYRSALITNAVTGKIDVRDFPIPDPVTKELCDA